MAAEFYSPVDQLIYKDNQFIPQEQYRLNQYNVPTEEEENELTTSTDAGIPYTNAFTNRGEDGGQSTLDLTYTKGAKAKAPATLQGDYDIYGNKINELGRTGLLGIKDKAVDFFSNLSTPKVRGTLGDRLSNRPSIPLPAAMASWSLSPFNEASRNYNPNFIDQLNFLEMGEGMIGRDSQSGHLRYGPESVLSGKNVISMFGTNSYEDALQKELARMEGHYKKGKTKLQWEKIQRIKDEIKSYDQQKTHGGDETTATMTDTSTGGDGDGDGASRFASDSGAAPGTTGSWTPGGTYTAPAKQSPSDAEGTPFAHGGRIGYNRGRVVNPGGYAGEDEGGILEWIKSKMGSESETNPTVFGTQNSLLNQGVITQLQDAIKTYEALMHMGDLDEEQQDDYELKLSQLQALEEGAQGQAQGGRVGFKYGGLATIL